MVPWSGVLVWRCEDVDTVLQVGKGDSMFGVETDGVAEMDGCMDIWMDVKRTATTTTTSSAASH